VSNLASKERLLRIRRKLAKKRPAFIRSLWWKFKKFDEVWRKPKGIDNKIRLKLKGYPPMPSAGYRGPAKVRGLHPSGLRPVVVSCTKDLEGLDPEVHIIYISSSVGRRKRGEIVRRARELRLKIANER